MCTYTWHTIVGAGPFREQPVPNLPGEDGGALPLKLGDLGDDVGCGNPGLAAPDGPRTDGPGLVIPAEDLGHAAVRHLQNARDVAGPSPTVGQLHDLLPRGVGQGPPVHVHPTQLVDTTVACKGDKRNKLTNRKKMYTVNLKT